MEPTHNTPWEQSLAQMAARFDYPRTPDIVVLPPREAAARRKYPVNFSHRLAWALLIIALLAAGALAVPQTRAAVLSFFARVGAIDIFIDETAPTATPSPSVVPSPTAEAASHSLTLFELGEPTGLEEAGKAVSFSLALPAALGQPAEVYIHRNVDLPAVSLVWRGPDGAPLSLTEIGVVEFATKLVHEQAVKSVRVGGRPAVWLAGPHRLQLLGSRREHENDLLIASNVLIWANDEVTYRLEGDLSEEEMIAIAESLP